MHKILFVLVLIFVFVGGFFVAKDTLSRIYKDLKAPSPPVNPVPSGCDENCQKAIANSVNQAFSTFSAGTQVLITPENAETVSKPQVSYIPLDGTFSTLSTDWVDAPGIEVSFDLAKDYGSNAKVSWEASLRVANANGTAYARLFDVTHGIALTGSEISVTNTSDFQRTSSGNLNLWAGRNVYRVQLKSLNSLNVDYSGGKIRISY